MGTSIEFDGSKHSRHMPVCVSVLQIASLLLLQWPAVKRIRAPTDAYVLIGELNMLKFEVSTMKLI